MRRPPRDPREPLFSLQMLGVSLLLGASCWRPCGSPTGGRWRPGARATRPGRSALPRSSSAISAMIPATRWRDPMVATLRAEPGTVVGRCSDVAALAASIYLAPLAGIFQFAPLVRATCPSRSLRRCRSVIVEVTKLARRR